MTDEPYAPVTHPGLDEYSLKATLEAVQGELIKLLRERQSIDLRIYKLQNDAIHLAALCHIEVEDPVKQLGLTDAVRFILAREKKPLTIPQIADALSKSSYDISEYKNVAANLHTIIGRLIKANEAKPMSAVAPYNRMFIWTGGLGPLPPLPDWLKERMKKKT